MVRRWQRCLLPLSLVGCTVAGGLLTRHRSGPPLACQARERQWPELRGCDDVKRSRKSTWVSVLDISSPFVKTLPKHEQPLDAEYADARISIPISTQTDVSVL